MAERAPYRSDATPDGSGRTTVAPKPTASLADRLRARWIAYRQTAARLSFDSVDLATARAIALTERLRGVHNLSVRALPSGPVCEMLFAGTEFPRLSKLEVSDYRYRIVVDGRQLYAPPRERMLPRRDGAHLASCLAAARVPILKSLELSDLVLGDVGIERLARAATLGKVESLRLSDVDLGDEGARQIATGPWSESLQELSLSYGTLGNAGAELLARAPWAPSLRRLAVHTHPLGAAGVEALLQRCRELKYLSFGGTEIDDDVAVAIASVKHPRLERLLLGRTAIGPRGATALAGARANFPALKYLDLDDCPLGEEGKASLKQSFWLKDAGRQGYHTRAGEQAAAYDRHIMDIAFPKK